MFRKVILLATILSFFSITPLWSQTEADSLQSKITELQGELDKKNKEFQNLKSTTTLKINQLEETIQEKKASIKKQTEEFDPPAKTFKEKKRSERNDQLASYFWFVFIVPIMFYLMYYWISKIPHFKLQEALSETGLNEDGKATAVSSSSRVIAFFSGIAAISIALSIAVISLVSSLVVQTIPDFQNMANVMLALGIGVVPYAVNKVSGSGSTKSPQSSSKPGTPQIKTQEGQSTPKGSEE